MLAKRKQCHHHLPATVPPRCPQPCEKVNIHSKTIPIYELHNFDHYIIFFNDPPPTSLS